MTIDTHHEYNLDVMTEQEVFDAACNHLLTQKKRSLSNSDRGATSCAYYGEDGLKCAAGIFIPEYKYSPGMEGRPWEAVVEQFDVPNAHKQLIIKLQDIHDMIPCEEWEAALKEIAEANGLLFNNVVSSMDSSRPMIE